MEDAETRRHDPGNAALIAAMPDGIEAERPSRIRHKRHSWLKRLQIASRVGRAVRNRAGPAFEQFRTDLSGNLPAPDAGCVILAACNDYYYWHFARAFVASIERTGERQTVHLHLCEPRSEVLANIATLAARLSAVRLTWTVDPCRLAAGLSHRTIYYAASRFLLAPLVLQRTGSPLLAVDVDSIAVRPVWQAYSRLDPEADLVLVERPGEAKPTMKVLASAFGINPTAEGVRFATELAQALAAVFAVRPRYHVDQIAIHYLLERVRRARNLRVAAMPKQFWNHDFEQDAAIWTAKGWSRKESGDFLEAVRAVETFFSDLPERREG